MKTYFKGQDPGFFGLRLPAVDVERYRYDGCRSTYPARFSEGNRVARGENP